MRNDLVPRPPQRLGYDEEDEVSFFFFLSPPWLIKTTQYAITIVWNLSHHVSSQIRREAWTFRWLADYAEFEKLVVSIHCYARSKFSSPVTVIDPFLDNGFGSEAPNSNFTMDVYLSDSTCRQWKSEHNMHTERRDPYGTKQTPPLDHNLTRPNAKKDANNNNTNSQKRE
ncbi:9512_t:CDS:2 [Acaulospora morrowiae]|uniref:9512_t:CDS:1 n=1 Tax=Acaulospora morrowiae TaxID=94023 RepID=A0A9N9BZN4_9GLOM|nr:9512_t:CDS:2 [Acaulospora morrowiae]